MMKVLNNLVIAFVLLAPCLFGHVAANECASPDGECGDETSVLLQRKVAVDSVEDNSAEELSFSPKTEALAKDDVNIEVWTRETAPINTDSALAETNGAFEESIKEEAEEDDHNQKGANYVQDPLESIDHTELAVLTGDCDSSGKNLTGVALKALGWERGVVIRYNMAPPDTRDSAMTFIKGDHCLAVFSATNDVTDRQQIIGGWNAQPVDMCGFKVNAGVAQEMTSFLVSPAYADFVAFLNDDKCKSVTAAGHSLGGTLATLWATCANVKANINQITFGVRSDYALVTFAPFAMATTAVYNGKPGVPFVGMRYSVTEVDGGASAQTGLHVDTKSFRLQLIELYSQLAKMSGYEWMATQAKALADVKMQFSDMSAGAIEGLWATTVYPQLQPLALWTLLEANKATAGAAAIGAQTAKFVASGVLSYEYDSVSSLGGFYGFKHALQDFQPLPNKLVAAKPGSSMTKVPAALASDLPKADLFQSLFSILAGGGGFVNHATCCYSSQDNTLCGLQYDEPEGRMCNNKLLAFMPATTTSMWQAH